MKKIENHVVLQPNQKGLQFYASRRQAEMVFNALIQRLSEKGPPYNTAHVPQSDGFLPSNLKRGSREHAIFLFVLCLWMRGGVESNTASTFLRRMYEERPEVFDPDMYWNWGPVATRENINLIAAVLSEYRLGQRVEDNAPGWVYNMGKLARFWKGDPRELMKDKPRFKTLVRRIIGKTTGKNGVFVNEDNPNGFMFFREKMAAMIAYFLMDAGLVPMFYTPVPVDIHVLRILVSNQVIRVRGKSTRKAIGIDFMKARVQGLARQVTEWYCRKHEVSPVALCDTLWLLSRSMCRSNPGNSGYVADDQRKLALKKSRAGSDDHPMLNLYELSVKLEEEALEIQDTSSGLVGRKRYLGLKHDANALLQPQMLKRFSQSCGICPLHSTCRYNISSGSYYVSGMLLPERLRSIPPDSQVDFLNHAAFSSSFHAPVDPPR